MCYTNNHSNGQKTTDGFMQSPMGQNHGRWLMLVFRLAATIAFLVFVARSEESGSQKTVFPPIVGDGLDDTVGGNVSGPVRKLRGRHVTVQEAVDLTAPLVSAAVPTQEEDGAKDVPPLQPRPVVIAGPSGVGKGTLIDLLLEYYSSVDKDGATDAKGGKYFGFSVSHTTRKPRPGEVDGEHYHFTDVDTMQREINEGRFIEHAHVHGNIYGTSFKAVQTVTNSGRICILDIDIQGVKGVKDSSLDPHYIFIAPPSMEELEQRLRDRGTEKEEDVRVRTQNAAREVEYGMAPGNFDAVVVNGDKDVAFRELVHLLEGWYPHLRGLF